MSGSAGSGVAQPVSHPAVVVQRAEGMVSAPGLRLGPRIDPPSCICPCTLYGIRVSVATWYIWAIGSRTHDHFLPRVVEMDTTPSEPIIMRPGSVGSAHMS